MELVQQLTQQLGINEQQATGGLGLLMGQAKSRLGGDFGKIAQHVPEVENVINSAPRTGAGGAEAAAGGLGGALGKIGGMFGNNAGSGSSGGIGNAIGGLGSLGGLVGGFQQLGLGPDMIGRFLPVVLGFFQRKGGDQTRGLLEKALA